MRGSIGLRHRRATLMAAVTGALALALSACGSGGYPETPLPTTAATPSSSATTAAAAPACDNATQTYDALAGLTGDQADAAVKAIRDRGYLVAGLSQPGHRADRGLRHRRGQGRRPGHPG